MNAKEGNEMNFILSIMKANWILSRKLTWCDLHFKKSLVETWRMEQMGSKREKWWQTPVKRLLRESKEHVVVFHILEMKPIWTIKEKNQRWCSVALLKQVSGWCAILWDRLDIKNRSGEISSFYLDQLNLRWQHIQVAFG